MMQMSQLMAHASPGTRDTFMYFYSQKFYASVTGHKQMALTSPKVGQVWSRNGTAVYRVSEPACWLQARALMRNRQNNAAPLPLMKNACVTKAI